MYSRKNPGVLLMPQKPEPQFSQSGLTHCEFDQIQAEVARRTAALITLTRHLQTAREDERRRIASDLHDELGALLTSAKLDAVQVKSRLTEAAPETQAMLTHLIETLNNCIMIKRRIIEGLHPSTLGHLGLTSSVEILARELEDKTDMQVHCELSVVKLDSIAELAIYRVVQESITNIIKYAKARNVWISMESKVGIAYVSVRDDGVGFDTSRPPESAQGLEGMRFRVEAEGGSFAIESAPGKGTLIRITLPQAKN